MRMIDDRVNSFISLSEAQEEIPCCFFTESRSSVVCNLCGHLSGDAITAYTGLAK